MSDFARNTHPADTLKPAATTGASLVVAVFACIYPLLDWVSYIYPMAHYNITPWNPQPALAIALLMTLGQRWLPVTALVIFTSEQLIRHTAAPWLTDILIALVLSLCYGAIAHALTHRYRISPRLDSSRDVLRLISVVIIGIFLTGILYVAAMIAGGAGPLELFSEALLRFWIGDSVGILVFLPLTLMLFDAGRRERLLELLKRRESRVQGASIVLVLLFVFGQDHVEQVKFFYLLFLPLVWISARSGLMGSAVAALLIQTGVIAAVHITGQTPLSVFELQTFLIALMIVGLFLGATVDEREQAELALRKSQKLVAAGQMAAALTHELSQPLTALANYARAGQLLVVAGERDQLRLEDTMQKLVVESRRTADIVRRLRDFLQHGTMRMAPTNLSELCREVMESMRETATASGITLRDDVAEGMPEIWADALQIEIVVRNLLRNAIDAAREAPAGNRHITMKITATADSIRLAVMDSGSGVPRGQAEHIFEPFETSKASGMGMGLAVSRAIVEAHQGHLWAESGEYGIFCLALPIKENEHG